MEEPDVLHTGLFDVPLSYCQFSSIWLWKQTPVFQLPQEVGEEVVHHYGAFLECSVEMTHLPSQGQRNLGEMFEEDYFSPSIMMSSQF